MSPAKKSNAKSKQKKGYLIDFGKYHEHIQSGENVEKLHQLTEEERRLLMDDYKKIKKVEKEEESELAAIKNFEKRLQELVECIVYLEGYIQQIEEGNSMLRINPSVKELGSNLVTKMEEVEKLSESMLNEEKKILGLAKHVNNILSKAKKYQGVIFG